MAENKTLSIISLVLVAGILLVLIGSFTGQPWRTVPENGGCMMTLSCQTGLTCVSNICVKLATPITPPEPTTGLTTQQKQDVLNMLIDCKITSTIFEPNMMTSPGKEICQKLYPGKQCILTQNEEIDSIRNQYGPGYLSDCSSPFYSLNKIRIDVVCC